MPPGPIGGPPLTRPFAIAAMPTQVIHGLCSMPAQVSAPRRPPGRSTRRISANATEGSGVNISPMRQATTSKEPSGRSMAAASMTAVSTLPSAAFRRRATSTMPGAMSLTTTEPVGPTSRDHVAPRLPGPAASSSTRSPGWTATRSSERRGGCDRVLVDVVRRWRPTLPPPRSMPVPGQLCMLVHRHRRPPTIATVDL